MRNIIAVTTIALFASTAAIAAPKGPPVIPPGHGGVIPGGGVGQTPGGGLGTACGTPAGAANPHCTPKPPKSGGKGGKNKVQASGGKGSGGVGIAAKYIGSAIACSAVSLVVAGHIANARSRRELTPPEAQTIVANCFLPFIGGWLVAEGYRRNPEWSRKWAIEVARWNAQKRLAR